MTNSFSVGVREHDRADVAALDHAAPSLIGPLSLTGAQLLADRRVGGDRADRLGDLAAADLDRGVDAVDDHAGLGDGQLQRPGQLGDGVVVGDRDAPAQGGEGDGPVHRAGVEVLQPEPLGERPGRRCSCRRPPARRWR